ncbi:MFS transporter [Phenylobacterium sp.]|uniref:MFS transporter n=1 Tax=Phenylobacterium sp. TaxID=1871053 RepID=UPI0025E7781B|nr:MFS transporter [Phenylobacterium sp.]MBX3482731.1 MFS transporter [Phenylobacterium sp.]
MSTARLLLTAKGLRAFGDGFTALLLPLYLTDLGLSAFQVGVVATSAMLGSAMLTLAVGLAGHRLHSRSLLMAACGLMLATGLAFSQAHAFWPLVVVAFMGTLSPSGGDVSVFAPVEQAVLAQAGPDRDRTARFARYSFVGGLGVAVGSLAVGLVDPIAGVGGVSRRGVIEGAFVLYGLIGAAAFLLYRRLPSAPLQDAPPPTALGPSRKRVLQLAALFSLDSFGSGFIISSLLALWLFHRFGMSLPAAGAFFFWTGLLTAVSQFAAVRLARRIGLVRTMVFTHLPACLCVAACAFAPNLATVLVLLTIRAALSNMDVPARSSYVMAVVTPAERAAAAGVTNVPRSLAASASPALAGLLFSAAVFPWPLLIGGGLKATYDLLLLRQFRDVRPPEEG